MSRALSSVRTVVLVGLGLLCAVSAQITGAQATPLYQSKTIVTGQEEPQRLIGFVRCFEQVLVKVSGDPRIAADPKLADLATRATDYVTGFRYRDRMEGIPVHDEQGTRERPYDLTVDFEPDGIDAALEMLGRKPWLAERPRIAIFATVENARGTYVLTSDGESGRDMREGLAATAERLGMEVVLPDQASLQILELDADTMANADGVTLDQATTAAGGEVALVGRIAWSSHDLGWAASWTMHEDGRDRWGIRGVGFDQAFRAGIGGAAQILSGNGAPE